MVCLRMPRASVGSLGQSVKIHNRLHIGEGATLRNQSPRLGDTNWGRHEWHLEPHPIFNGDEGRSDPCTRRPPHTPSGRHDPHLDPRRESSEERRQAILISLMLREVADDPISH